MISRVQRYWRYENGPDRDDLLRQLYSSDLDNPDVTPATFLAGPTNGSLHNSHLKIQPFSLPLTSISHGPLFGTKTSTIQNRRKESTPSTELHQPIGFVCCHCRYHSSGCYCSNPDDVECPHKIQPRCRNCAIIFTRPRRRHDTCEDG
jgi:hypothetical protein